MTSLLRTASELVDFTEPALAVELAHHATPVAHVECVTVTEGLLEESLEQCRQRGDAFAHPAMLACRAAARIPGEPQRHTQSCGCAREEILLKVGACDTSRPMQCLRATTA